MVLIPLKKPSAEELARRVSAKKEAPKKGSDRKPAKPAESE